MTQFEILELLKTKTNQRKKWYDSQQIKNMLGTSSINSINKVLNSMRKHKMLDYKIKKERINQTNRFIRTKYIYKVK